MLAATVAAVAWGWFAWREWDFLNVPPEHPGREVRFTVEPGQPFYVIARNLGEAGLLRDPERFVEYAMELGATGSVRAGEFVLHTGWTPPTLLKVLTTSPGVMDRVQVPEGRTWWQTALLAEAAGLGTRESFAKTIRDPALLKEYRIPADTAEGYLFPETYLMTPPKEGDAEPLVRAMLDEFFERAALVWPGGPPAPEELHEVVILASLVEKETGDPSERARIAGVYANRLRRGMLLQADPTVIYGLGEDFDGNLKRVHLKDKANPYNTYARTGLPPGPICSPGQAAIEAAANPEEHGYYYFVAKGDGSHHFSTSLSEHNAAVAKYQLRRNRKTYRSTKTPQ